jgi:hypothetical protein
MHCELLAPALFSAPGAAAAERFPALERLLARGRRSRYEPASPERWLARAFGFDGDELPAGALTLLGEGGAPGDALWARADPIHLRPQRERLLVVPADALAVARDEAESLVEAINRHFSGELTLFPVHPERWCARLEGRLADAPAPGADSPLELAGRDAASILPRDERGRRWNALANEIQMLLHAHPVNAAREERREPAIGSVWFWGMGRAPAAARAAWTTLAAADPVARGLARVAGIAREALPEAGEAWLAARPREGRHLAVLDGLRAPRALGDDAVYTERLRALEERWFAPLLDALRRGRIGMVTIHVPDAGAAFETIRSDLRRFWRRARPLAAYAP